MQTSLLCLIRDRPRLFYSYSLATDRAESLREGGGRVTVAKRMFKMALLIPACWRWLMKY